MFNVELLKALESVKRDALKEKAKLQAMADDRGESLDRTMLMTLLTGVSGMVVGEIPVGAVIQVASTMFAILEGDKVFPAMENEIFQGMKG